VLAGWWNDGQQIRRCRLLRGSLFRVPNEDCAADLLLMFRDQIEGLINRASRTLSRRPY
jgi:hypothetical protein